MFRWFTNLKVAHKLALGFGIILLLMLNTLAVDISASTQQAGVVNNLVHHLYPARQAAAQIMTLIRSADDDGAWYLMETRENVAVQYLSTYYQEVQKIRETLVQAKAQADTDGQRQDIQQFSAFYFGKDGYYDGNEICFKLKRAGKAQAAYATYVEAFLTPSVYEITLYIETVDHKIAQETAHEQMAASLVLILSLSLGGLALVLGLGIATLIVRSITRPLTQVQRVAHAVSTVDVANIARGLTALAQGDLTLTVQARTPPPLYESRDEIGQTAQAIRGIITNIHRTLDGYEIARQHLQLLYSQLDEQNKALSSANVRLESLATTDPLTGLPNRRLLLERLEEEISRCGRMQNFCALLFLDIDHFKQINDTWGHAAGDSVLREVGNRLKRGTRVEDVAGRYGGEEFVLVLTNTTVAEACETAERLRAIMAASPCVWEDTETEALISIQITVSMGVAFYPEHGSRRDLLLEAADTAMYHAKRTGRNRVCMVGEETELLRLVEQDGSKGEVGMVQALSTIAQVHDQGTSLHAQRMVLLAQATAQRMGRPEVEVHLVRLAALLHDIGKVGVPEAILNKPGPLTEEEWAVMRRHPKIGRLILQQAGGQFELLSHIVVAHHERWDGNGYPYGLAGEEIPLAARIISVVDAFDAMTADRPYRAALSLETAMEELQRSAGSQFDPQVVAAFLHVIETMPHEESPDFSQTGLAAR